MADTKKHLAIKITRLSWC